MTDYALRCLTAFALLAISSMVWAQAPVPSVASQWALPPTPATSDTGPTASALLAPAISEIRQALATLRVEKWKAPGAVAQETASNVSSIQRDLDNTLPGLLESADYNPASVADALPAYRNVEALYDVVLRVTEVAKLGAPAQQSSALQQATGTLEDARRAFGDRLQASAAAQGRSVSMLQTQLRTAQSALTQPSVAPACPVPPAVVKKRTPSKPKPKPTTPQSAAPPH